MLMLLGLVNGAKLNKCLKCPNEKAFSEGLVLR